MFRNLRTVAWLAHKYKWACEAANQLIDLLQEGTMGLMIAVQRFDVAKDIKFSTFGYWWTRQKMTRYLHDTAGTIRASALHEQLIRMKRWNGVCHIMLQRIHASDVAAALGVPPSRA